MLKRLLIAAMFITYLFGRPCVAKQQHGGTHTAQDVPGQSQRPIPPAHVVIDPPFPAPVCQPLSTIKTEATPENPLPRFLRPEWVIVYITAAYSLIAGLTLWVIKRQADTMDTQAKDARDSAAAAVVTTQATLIAIEKQAKELSRQNKNMVSRERARIAIKVLRVEMVDLKGINKIPINVENLGPTHAFNVRTKGNTRVIVEGLDPPDIEEDDDLIYPNDGVIRVGHNPSETYLSFLVPEEWLLMEVEPTELKIRLEVFGEIMYDDIFGGKDHITKFSYFMNVLLKQTSYINPRKTDQLLVLNVSPFSQWRKSEKLEDNHAT